MNTTSQFLSAMLLLTGLCSWTTAADWPQAAGPNGTWTIKTEEAFPTKWSGSTGHNIAWSTELEEGGQSGIAVSGNRIFLTINKPLPIHTRTQDAVGTDIVGLCFDAATGKKLWQVDIPGTKPMPHTGLFADNTSPTPVTDGQHVWFVNAGGSIVCCRMDGGLVWSREFEARTRHNAKNAEPMLHGDWLLYVLMRDPDDPLRRPMLAEAGNRKSKHTDWPWTFIRAFQKSTGESAWVAQAGTSIHNTPVCRTINGQTFVFHGRGGGHRPPEEPYGFSLTSLNPKNPGRTVWRHDISSGMAFFATHFDHRFAYCFDTNVLKVLDVQTGNPAQVISLKNDVDVRTWDETTQKYSLAASTTFKPPGKKIRPYPTNQTNIVVGNHCLFMTHEGHMIGRANVITGKVEYLQVPVQVVRVSDTSEKLLWSIHIPADTRNSRGMDVGVDRRVRGDGWGHVTSAGPIAVNNLVFFSTMLGTVYVIDASADVLDSEALVAVNDLGPAGKTWTLNSLSHSNGRFFHRTLKRVMCIAVK